MPAKTPADDNYQPLHPGDLRPQYAAVLDGLTLQLKAAGATWDDGCFGRMYAVDVPAFLKVLKDKTLPVPWDASRPSPSTLIGVTVRAATAAFARRSRRGALATAAAAKSP